MRHLIVALLFTAALACAQTPPQPNDQTTAKADAPKTEITAESTIPLSTIKADPNEQVSINGKIYRVSELMAQIPASSDNQSELRLRTPAKTTREKTEQAAPSRKSNPR